MAWLVRTVACLSALAIIGACASIAGLEDPGPGNASDGTTPRPASSSSSGSTSGSSDASSSSSSGASGSTSSTSSSSSSGNPAPDSGSADTGPPPPPEDSGVPGCMKAQNNESCDSQDKCCSNACNEQHLCKSSCENSGGSCPFRSANDCCVGFWCGGQALTKCIPCIPGNSPMGKDLVGVMLEWSCCSRSGNYLTGKCN